MKNTRNVIERKLAIFRNKLELAVESEKAR